MKKRMNPFVDVFPVKHVSPVATETIEPNIREDRKLLQNIRSLASSVQETTVLTNGMTVSEFCFRYIRLYHFRNKRPAS